MAVFVLEKLFSVKKFQWKTFRFLKRIFFPLEVVTVPMFEFCESVVSLVNQVVCWYSFRYGDVSLCDSSFPLELTRKITNN
jgi:hypothetical protein